MPMTRRDDPMPRRDDSDVETGRDNRCPTRRNNRCPTIRFRCQDDPNRSENELQFQGPKMTKWPSDKLIKRSSYLPENTLWTRLKIHFVGRDRRTTILTCFWWFWESEMSPKMRWKWARFWDPKNDRMAERQKWHKLVIPSQKHVIDSSQISIRG